MDSKTSDLKNCTTVVIYHGGCPDGTSAAWAISLCLDNSKTYYHYGKFKEPYPDVKGKDVIFVDFTYPLDVTLKMLQEAKSVLVLDHHETAKQLQFVTDPRLTLNLDMNRSGAQMAWDYAADLVRTRGFLADFCPAKFGTHPIPEPVTPRDDTIKLYMETLGQLMHTTTRPWFIDDIADRDLWRWQIPGCKDSTRAMFASNVYESINTFYSLIDKNRDDFVRLGVTLNADDERNYKALINNAIDANCVTPDGKQSWKVRIVECDHTMASEVGNRLVQDGLCDFSVMYRYNLLKDEWWLSCRALPGSAVDLTKILPLIDPKGGGHPKAAGMTLSGGNALSTYFKPVKEKFSVTAANTVVANTMSV